MSRQRTFVRNKKTKRTGARAPMTFRLQNLLYSLANLVAIGFSSGPSLSSYIFGCVAGLPGRAAGAVVGGVRWFLGGGGRSVLERGIPPYSRLISYSLERLLPLALVATGALSALPVLFITVLPPDCGFGDGVLILSLIALRVIWRCCALLCGLLSIALGVVVNVVWWHVVVGAGSFL